MIEFNQTERTIVECVRERTREELAKRVPSIDNIDYRRLTYLLIEDRMAMYEEADRSRGRVIEISKKKKEAAYNAGLIDKEETRSRKSRAQNTATSDRW